MLETAVLDSASTGALLWLARREGLLQEDRWQTDGFIDTHAPKRIPAWLRDQLLEQLVLTPRLATFQRLPQQGLSGELFDRGLLTPLEQKEIEAAPLQVPAEMVIGALRARGHEGTWPEIQACLERAWLAEVEAEKFKAKHGRPLPTGWMLLSAQMIALMKGKSADNAEPPEGYTRQDVEMAVRHSDAHSAARPIVNAIDELFRLFSFAERSHVLFRPAIVPTRGRTIPVGESHQGAIRAGALFRVVSRILDVPIHGPDLRSTLQIARDPAATSLRYNLPLWLNELSAGNIKPAMLIEREIRHANETLARSAKLMRASRVIAYFIAPTVVVEFMRELPPIAGLSIHFVSEVVRRKAEEQASSVEWIHFGSRRL